MRISALDILAPGATAPTQTFDATAAPPTGEVATTCEPSTPIAPTRKLEPWPGGALVPPVDATPTRKLEPWSGALVPPVDATAPTTAMTAVSPMAAIPAVAPPPTKHVAVSHPARAFYIFAQPPPLPPFDLPIRGTQRLAPASRAREPVGGLLVVAIFGSAALIGCAMAAIAWCC